MTNVCRPCQDSLVAQKVEQDWAEAEKRAAERRASEEENKRREEQQARDAAEHQARVARHEAASGWLQVKVRVVQLEKRIRKTYKVKPLSPGEIAWTIILTILAVVVVLMVVAMVRSATVTSLTQDALDFCALALTPWLSGFLVYFYVRAFQYRLRQVRISKRNELIKLQGCGDPDCSRCTAWRFGPN
jgi:hypothetical protein